MTELGEHKKMLSADEQATLVEALMAIRSKVCWKPGKDVVHHQKRQNMGHLPASCSAILILKRYPCGSGFPAAKNRGKMPLTRYLRMNLAP